MKDETADTTIRYRVTVTKIVSGTVTRPRSKRTGAKDANGYDEYQTIVSTEYEVAETQLYVRSMATEPNIAGINRVIERSERVAK
jgi:hypothetical protein